jgi:outer membrane receptor protein involved in Fe transport
MNVPNTVLITGLNLYSRETFLEARITSPQDTRLRYSIGVSDYKLRYRNGRAPLGSQLVAGSLPDVDFQNSHTTAVFGSIDYDVSDDFTVSVEARYTDEKSLAILQGNPNRPCGASPVCNEENSYDDFIPRVILSYQPFEGATTYASYSYSSLLGVATQAAFVNQVAPLVIPDNQVSVLGLYTKPQENVQYELGWKQVLDNWAFTMAVFASDWKNQPFASVILLPSGGTTSFRGPGNSTYKGFDFEFQGQPTDWLQLAGTLGYTDGNMKSFSSRGSNESAVLGSGPLSVDNSGQKPRNVPAWTASLSPTILGNIGERDYFIRTDFTYHSKTWADYSGFNRAPDRFRINARAGININDNTALELAVKNLTNNKTMGLSGGTTSGPSGSRKAFQEPWQKREVSIRIKANF